jgi:hypothetical protein
MRINARFWQRVKRCIGVAYNAASCLDEMKLLDACFLKMILKAETYERQQGCFNRNKKNKACRRCPACAIVRSHSQLKKEIVTFTVKQRDPRRLEGNNLCR